MDRKIAGCIKGHLRYPLVLLVDEFVSLKPLCLEEQIYFRVCQNRTEAGLKA